MTASNRVLARVLLLLIGVALVAAGVTITLLASLMPALSQLSVAAVVTSIVGDSVAFFESTGTAAAVGAAVALALALWLIGYAVTRGRGRVSTALVIPAETDAVDRVDVSVSAVRDIARHVASETRTLETVDVHAYRVGRRALRRSGFETSPAGGAALLISATVRKGADPVDAHRELSAIVERLDQALELVVPVVMHLTATRHREARAD